MIAAEALVAVTGLFPEQPLRVQDGLAARGLVNEWRSLIKAFFDQDKPRKFKLYSRPAHEAMLNRLTEGDDPNKLVGKLADPDVATEYLATLSNAREYLRERWPSLKTETFMGPRLLEPGWVSMAEAWAILAVLDHPTRILTEMLSGTLLAEQLEALKAVFPDLFKMLLALIDERKELERAKKQSYSVPWRKERIFRIVYGLPPEVSIDQAPQAPARMGRPAPIKINFAASQTRAQRIAAK